MLAGIRGLFHGDRVFTFDHKSVEVFTEEDGDSLGHRAHNPDLGVVDFVQNSQSPVLKDRVSVQYKEPCFHKCASKGKK